DNSEWNIAERIAVAEGEAKRLREELNEIDKALGFDTWRGTRAERIAELHGRLNAALSTGAKA
ncbi:MAG TPA: hypothetical protein VGQ34_11545, partial [Sphingomicrobium sp.]|nr:hypothetical protein [Sphingomicrobium sp.]